MSAGEHDPFCWNPGAPQARGAAGTPGIPVVTAVESRRTRRWTLAGGGGALAVGGVAAAILLAGGGASGALPSTTLARAADVTAHVPGFKFTLTMDATTSGQGVTLNASGEFNSRPLTGSMTMTYGGTAVSELFVAPYAYLQVPSAGPGWKRVDVTPYLPSQSLGGGAISGLDPEELLAYLRSVGSVTSVGEQSIDSTQTTHYHALVDLGRLAASLPSGASAQASGLVALSHALGAGGIPIDAWLDAQQRVRQLTIALPIHADGTTAEITLSMNLYDYAAQPPVSAPPAADVTSLSGA